MNVVICLRTDRATILEKVTGEIITSITIVPTNSFVRRNNALIPLFEDVRLQNSIVKLFSICLTTYQKIKFYLNFYRFSPLKCM